MNDISYLVVITNKKQKDALVNELAKVDAKFFNIMYGKGLVKANEFLKAFGLVSDQQKVIITSLIKSDKVDSAFAMLEEKFNISEPNSGIAFTIPINKMSK